MSEIKTIVYLMLENRSIDNLLGWLYDAENPPKICIPHEAKPSYDGLKPNTYFNLDADGGKHFVTRGTGHDMGVPSGDSYHEFSHVCYQLFGSRKTPVGPTPPTMGGFYRDYETLKQDPDQIMQTYVPEGLPVLNGLAKNFAVSDRYFSSVPTQTDCNRAFAACGNTLGNNAQGELVAFVNNRGDDQVGQPRGRQFNQRTLWNVLIESGKDSTSDWMIHYCHGTWYEDLLGAEGYSYTRDLMEQLQSKSLDPHFADMDAFIKNAEAGTLPTLTFLEPKWAVELGTALDSININGNDFHPPANLEPGEVFVKRIYDALTSNTEAWAQTLFIINFDEHGGTYDHVAPPWGATAPWANGDTPAPKIKELDFEFDRFGVRVPLLLVSPWVEESTVFRAEGATPYDHTSVIATILTLMGLPKVQWKLGARTANAPTFEGVLSRATPRTDVPPVEINRLASAATTVESKPNDIQLRMAERALERAVQRKRLEPGVVHGLTPKPLASAKTTGELASLLDEGMNKLRSL